MYREGYQNAFKGSDSSTTYYPFPPFPHLEKPITIPKIKVSSNQKNNNKPYPALRLKRNTNKKEKLTHRLPLPASGKRLPSFRHRRPRDLQQRGINALGHPHAIAPLLGLPRKARSLLPRQLPARGLRLQLRQHRGGKEIARVADDDLLPSALSLCAREVSDPRALGVGDDFQEPASWVLEVRAEAERGVVDEVGERSGRVEGAVVGIVVHGCYETLGDFVSVAFRIFYRKDLEGRHLIDIISGLCVLLPGRFCPLGFLPRCLGALKYFPF